MPSIAQQPGSGIEPDEEMLSQEPPPVASRLIGWLLIVIFVTVAAVSVLVPIPESTQCRFVLVSESGTDPIQTRLLAVVQKVAIEEGQQVSAGQELFQLRSDEIRSWQTQRRTYQDDLRSLKERIPKAEQSYQEQVTIQKVVLARAGRELEFARKHLANKQDMTARMKQLAADGIIPALDLADRELELQESQKNLDVAGQVRDQAKLELGRLTTERERARTEEKTSLAQTETRISALDRQLESCQDDVMVIRAPYDGVVISLAQKSAGNVVDEGHELCQLARLDARPRAQLLLKEDGLPKLEGGQVVQFFFDAFPYQRYGTVKGKLAWISLAAAKTPQGQIFSGSANLNRLDIMVDGKPKPLQVGMNGQARIRTGERTLIEFAFEPLRQLRENVGH